MAEDEGDFADEPLAGIRAWQCSICANVQRIEIDLCKTCGHPRNDEPASEDVVYDNWRPNAGEDDGEPEAVEDEQFEGMYQAVEAAAVVDNRRGEGEAVVGSDDEWSEAGDAESDWDGTVLKDPFEPDIRDMPTPDPPIEGPRGSEAGWLCGLCGRDNSLLDIDCNGCGHTRNMRDNGFDDIIVRRPEVTAGERPNMPLEEKEETYEVWTCPGCTVVNDYVSGQLKCRICEHVVDSTLGEFVSYNMSATEYEELVRKQQRPPAGAAAGGGAPAAGGRRNSSSNNYAYGRKAAKDVARVPRPFGEPKPPSGRSRPAMPVSDFSLPPNTVRKYVRPKSYPLRTDPSYKEPNRVGQVVGQPRPLECFAKARSYWRNGAILYPCLRLQEAIEEGGLYGRGFAVNERGRIALLTRSHLRVYEPMGPSFAVVAETEFQYAVAASPHPVRVRYHHDCVYVFVDHSIYRYRVAGGRLEMDAAFADDYMKEQKFMDMDVDDDFVIACWRKWAGLYGVEEFNWFHAVSTSTVLVNPKSISFKHKYIHVSMGSCILAYHVSSRDPAVLWVAGNLPTTDCQFCVSDRYGVFTSVNDDIVQSYYDAHSAQSIYRDDCKNKAGVSVTPTPFEVDRKRHLVHPKVRAGHHNSPFASVSSIQYDERYGDGGRLLCWDSNSAVLFMTLNREEFAPLEDVFRRFFHVDYSVSAVEERSVDEQEVTEADIPSIGYLDEDAIAALKVDDNIDFRCSDGRFRSAVVRARGGNSFMVVGAEDFESERITNVSSYVGKIALSGEVSSRGAHLLRDLDVGGDVEVNFDSRGWTPGVVEDMFLSQVMVRVGNGEVQWTCVDFVNEIRRRSVFDADPEDASEPTAGAIDLAANLSREQRDAVEERYMEYIQNYSEPVVQFFLRSAIKLAVSSTAAGVCVFRHV